MCFAKLPLHFYFLVFCFSSFEININTSQNCSFIFMSSFRMVLLIRQWLVVQIRYPKYRKDSKKGSKLYKGKKIGSKKIQVQLEMVVRAVINPFVF